MDKHDAIVITPEELALAKKEELSAEDAVAKYKQLMALKTCDWCKQRQAVKMVRTKGKGKGVKPICAVCWKQNSKPAVAAIKNQHTKLKRNDPCPCGSGKKYKKCHWPSKWVEGAATKPFHI